MKVIMYSMSDCPYCERAKQFLQSNGIDFAETKIDNPEDRKAFYEEHNNVRTMPQIFIDGERIGGYTQLMEQKNDIIARAAIDFLDKENVSF